ncbi:MAG TPA: sodium/proton-translocating pyrophosphatase, partial [Clostridia bacterium]|nr:sodium/proton-translocating pyrophosphatase [Clostridia bacterium]
MELNLTTTFAFSIAIAVVSFLVAAYFYVWVKKCPSSNKKIESIGKLIAKGANAFLRREYLVLARFVAVATVLIVV